MDRDIRSRTTELLEDSRRELWIQQHKLEPQSTDVPRTRAPTCLSSLHYQVGPARPRGICFDLQLSTAVPCWAEKFLSVECSNQCRTYNWSKGWASVIVEGIVHLYQLPQGLGSISAEWAEREQELGDGQGCCECCPLDMTMVFVLKNPQQLWLLNKVRQSVTPA